MNHDREADDGDVGRIEGIDDQELPNRRYEAFR
jgi:hypothetical protein